MKTIIIFLLILKMQLFASEIDSIPRSFTYKSELKPLTKENLLDFRILKVFNNDSLKNEESKLKNEYPDLPDLYGVEEKVNCSTGVDWCREKRSVALFWLDNSTRYCSSSLINNVNNDGTPYILTADHCIDGDEDYNLLPLEDLENLIKRDKHLPEIPSATEVQQNGVALGDMQAKLLKKVEELTLYVIELKKENEELNSRINTIEDKKDRGVR